ncbi:MAG: hypothetical protein M9929_16290 [Burkholderiaceae bacterium]|nr:hypothetical protein [Burkholderiaceae bacterium]
MMLTIPRLVELSNALDCPVEAFIPKVSGSTRSSTNEIAKMLKPLSKRDMQFVMDIQRTCTHRTSSNRAAVKSQPLPLLSKIIAKWQPIDLNRSAHA